MVTIVSRVTRDFVTRSVRIIVTRMAWARVWEGLEVIPVHCSDLIRVITEHVWADDEGEAGRQGGWRQPCAGSIATFLVFCQSPEHPPPFNIHALLSVQ